MGFSSGGLAIGSVMHGQEDFFTRAALLLSKNSSLHVVRPVPGGDTDAGEVMGDLYDAWWWGRWRH